MTRPYMGDPGMYTGLADRHGTPVHVGDVLSFDPEQWGSICEFVVGFSGGELDVCGVPRDIPEWCVVVWPWDTDEARAWRAEKAKQEG